MSFPLINYSAIANCQDRGIYFVDSKLENQFVVRCEIESNSCETEHEERIMVRQYQSLSQSKVLQDLFPAL